MKEKVLFVDDDPQILSSFNRTLRKQFAMETASGPREGLNMIAQKGPFAVVVSDLRMPGLDGSEFLSRVRRAAPDTVRMLLTGYADLQSAMVAVNEGKIFQLLTKPCSPHILAKAISSGIQQYRLITAERQLLEKTFRGSIKVLMDLMAMINPEIFGKSSRIKRHVCDVSEHMNIANPWQLEVAAMLSQIGLVTLPEDTVVKQHPQTQLEDKEKQLMDNHPAIAANLLANIPRMEKIAEMIAYQSKHFDGSNMPSYPLRGQDIPLGARILKVVIDFDSLQSSGISREEAIEEMETRSGRYDPTVLEALKAAVGLRTTYEFQTLGITQLREHMILAEDVRSRKGQLLISKGQEVSQPLIERLKNFLETSQIQEPLQVAVPVGGIDQKSCKAEAAFDRRPATQASR